MDIDAEFQVDKTAFSVVSLEEADDELSYRLTKMPQECLRAVELIRQILYGYTPAAARLPKVLEIAQREETGKL